MIFLNHNLAIAIGINNYSNGIAELETARPDAEKLAGLLSKDYEYQVELITDKTARKPTLTEIRTLLTEWLPQQLHPPAEKNRLLFYFAGHGMPLESDDGPRGFLLPQDADPRDSSTFLPMQELHDALIALPCHHLLIILDCCFAGTFRWSSTRKAIPIPETIHRQHYDRFIRYPAWQVIASSAHNQEALDFLSDKRGTSQKGAKHSPFAEALFEALQDGEPDDKGNRYKKADLTKDGVITAPELYLYLRDNVETRSGERQTPGLFPLKRHDRGEYIFHDPNFDPTTLSEAPELDEANNPYRGLKPFEEQHARFFFGRHELIKQLCARITAPDHALTVVLGVSGSGKSSLVKAGLIPHLRNDKTHQWQILSPMRPGESPFASLARTLFAIADTPVSPQLNQLDFLNELLQREEQLNAEMEQVVSEGKRNSSRASQLEQNTETLNQIIADWNDASPLVRQRLLVEHFEMLHALCQLGEQESEQQRQLKQTFLACLAPLTQQLQSDPESLVTLAHRWEQNHLNTKLLLVIDQFEELITLGRTTTQDTQSGQLEEWQQFLRLLETTLAANLPQLRIIVTIRSDFEPRFLSSEALKPYWSKARFPVRAMRSDELRQAIEGPASEMALYFEPANLVDRLIDEVGQMPGALPLLSFTLSELYVKLSEKWRNQETSDRALTIDAEFDQEGGVAGSLTRRANEEYDKLVKNSDTNDKYQGGFGQKEGKAYQVTMRRIMLRMLTLEGGETARRRVPDSELIYPTQEESDRVKQVVDRLVNARLLVRGKLETGEPYVEPAHDFLVRGWGTFQDWINEEKAKETLELQQRLTAQANDWDRSNRPDGLLLPDGDRFKRLIDISKSFDSWLNQEEIDFLKASQRKISVELARVRLPGMVETVNNNLSRDPQGALIATVEIIRQNLEYLPDEILTPVQNCLYKAMEMVRIPEIRLNLKQEINTVRFTRDGKKIVVGCEHGEVYIQNLDDSNCHHFQCCEESVAALSVSSSNEMLATISVYGTIQLWDLQGNPIGQSKELHGTPIVGLPNKGHQSFGYSINFNPDGNKIAACSYQYTAVFLWDLYDESKSLSFEAHERGTLCVKFSPDGQKILTCGEDARICLWDLAGNLINQLQGHQEAVTSLDISSNAHWIVSGSLDKSIRLWDLKANPVTSEVLRTCKSSVYAVNFSSDSRQIGSCGADRLIYLWDLQGNLLGLPLQSSSDSVYDIAFNPVTQSIASGGTDGRVYLWDFQSSLISQFSWDDQRLNPSITYSPEKGLTFTGKGTLLNVQLDRLSEFSQYEKIALSLVHSTDGRLVVTGNVDGTVCIWNLEDKSVCQTFHSHEAAVTSVAISSDDQYIVSCSSDGVAKLWSLTGEEITNFLQAVNVPVTSVAFSPDGQTIACGSNDGTVYLWSLLGYLIDEPFPDFGLSTTSLIFAPDGQKIVIGSDETLFLWSLQNDGVSRPFKAGHTGSITSLDVSPNGLWIASGSRDKTIRLWDFRGKPIGVPFRGHEDSVLSISISPDGQSIASSSDDGTIRLWDLKGNPIGQPFQGHQDSIYSIDFSPDGLTIISSSRDGTLCLWQGGWRSWLTVCCNRIHNRFNYHPLLLEDDNEDLYEDFMRIRETCRACKRISLGRTGSSVG